MVVFFYLMLWSLNKMAAILADNIFRCIFWNQIMLFWFKFHWIFFLKDAIGYSPALVQIMAWRSLYRCQAIIWTNDDLVCWCMNASGGLVELIFIVTSTCIIVVLVIVINSSLLLAVVIVISTMLSLWWPLVVYGDHAVPIVFSGGISCFIRNFWWCHIWPFITTKWLHPKLVTIHRT